MDKKYPPYKVVDLEKHLEHIDKSIKSFEKAIDDENEKRRDTMRLIAECKERDALSG